MQRLISENRNIILILSKLSNSFCQEKYGFVVYILQLKIISLSWDLGQILLVQHSTIVLYVYKYYTSSGHKDHVFV